MALEPEIVESESEEEESVLIVKGYPTQETVQNLQCDECAALFCYRGPTNPPFPSYCPECGTSFLDTSGSVNVDEDSWKES